MSNSMSVEAEKGPEPWLLKAAIFTTFRPFSRPFNLKMASVAKGSSMLNTFEWVPLPQLTKICKEKDSIYQMGCAFFFFTHLSCDPIWASIGWKWTPKTVRFFDKKGYEKDYDEARAPRWKPTKEKLCMEKGLFTSWLLLQKTFLFAKTELQNFLESFTTILLLLSWSKEVGRKTFVFFVLLKRHWMSPRSKTGINLGCLKIYFYRVS